MTGARLASSVLAAGLIRLAESQGGFGMVLAKGDETAGAVTVVLLERGGDPRLFERVVQPDGSYAWEETAGSGEDEEGIRARLDKRRRIDPDLWIIELDTASSERFAAEMNALN